MDTPLNLRYTVDHEWLRLDGSRAVVGVTDFAQKSMGDVVHVELPHVGQAVRAGDVVAEIETTKSVSEVYAPVAGTIAGLNEGLREHPELVNVDPYGAGWLFSMNSDVLSPIDLLLDAATYESMLETAGE